MIVAQLLCAADLLSDDDRALLDTLGGGPASGDVLKRRGELQRSLEAHVRQMQMKYEVLNPSVEVLCLSV
jgi:hypothetical protein